MAKKDFKRGQNPALDLLGIQEEVEKAEEKREENQKEARNKKKSKGTKSPKENEKEVPKGYVLKPEAKSKRVNLLMQPTLYEDAQKAAKKEKVSFNEYIHILIREDIGRQKKEL